MVGIRLCSPSHLYSSTYVDHDEFLFYNILYVASCRHLSGTESFPEPCRTFISEKHANVILILKFIDIKAMIFPISFRVPMIIPMFYSDIFHVFYPNDAF